MLKMGRTRKTSSGSSCNQLALRTLLLNVVMEDPGPAVAPGEGWELRVAVRLWRGGAHVCGCFDNHRAMAFLTPRATCGRPTTAMESSTSPAGWHWPNQGPCPPWRSHLTPRVTLPVPSTWLSMPRGTGGSLITKATRWWSSRKDSSPSRPSRCRLSPILYGPPRRRPLHDQSFELVFFTVIRFLVSGSHDYVARRLDQPGFGPQSPHLKVTTWGTTDRLPNAPLIA